MVNIIEFSERKDFATCLIHKVTNRFEKSTIRDKFECVVNKKRTVRHFIHLVSQHYNLDVDSFFLLFSSYQVNSSSETKTKKIKLVEQDDRLLADVGLLFGEGAINRFLLSENKIIESDKAICIVRYKKDLKTYPLEVEKNVTASEFYFRAFQLLKTDGYHPSFFVLIYNTPVDTLNINIVDDDPRLLSDIGITYYRGVRHFFEVLIDDEDIMCSEDDQPSKNDHSYTQGLKSSIPRYKTPSPLSTCPKTTSCVQYNCFTEGINLGYRGLVNQAQTCYLNSLLQTLYMTPEFRNMLYHWKYDFNDVKKDASKSISFQLQQLFLKLQTSSQASIETTNFTYSLNWDSSEAFRQKDVQEFFRDMFESLEKELQNTTYFDLLNKLYQGKLIDIIKCLECGNERLNEVTFLDIPLAIRPIGSSDAYGCLEEAFQGYVKPETLEGENQYQCEKCNKRCNAHKSMKFSRFPYILTVHLLRYSYDLRSLERYKLHDKIEFPEILDLNSFISDKSCLENEEELSEELFGPVSNCYVNSFTDTDTSPTQRDENGSCQNGNKDKYENSRPEPFVYALYAVLMHSGNAITGHYFAYIKDFKTDQWLCFNDQTVTKISVGDLEKSFGGINTQENSGPGTSSTNAYMLMYRRIDKKQNRNAMSPEEFPPHIKNLQHFIERFSVEDNKQMTGKKQEEFKATVYLANSVELDFQSMVFDCVRTTTIKQLKLRAMKHFEVFKPCQFVIYNTALNAIVVNLENEINNYMNDIICLEPCILLLKTDKSSIAPGHILMKLFMVNLDDNEEDIDLSKPTEIEMERNKLLEDLKSLLYLKYDLSGETKIYFAIFNDDYLELSIFETNEECSLLSSKDVFVFIQRHCTSESTLMQQIKNIGNRFLNTIQVQFILPTNSDVIQKCVKLNIKNTVNSHGKDDLSIKSLEKLTVNTINAFGRETVDQSEDNRITNNERMIVEDVEMDSSAVEHYQIKMDDCEIVENNHMCVTEDNDEPQLYEKYFFKIVPSLFEVEGRFDACVDKRMNVHQLKNYLSPLMNMPYDNIILHIYQSDDTLELALPDRTLVDMGDFDTFQVSFDEPLLDNQYRVSIYYQDPQDFPYFLRKVFDSWIITAGTSVLNTKKELVSKFKKILNIEIPLDRIRLRKRIGNTLLNKCYMNEDIWNKNIGLNWEIAVFDLMNRSEYELDKNKHLVLVFHVKRRVCSLLDTISELEFVVDKELTDIKLVQMISLKLEVSEEDVELGYTKNFDDIIWKKNMCNSSIDLFDENICILCRLAGKTFLNNNFGFVG